MCEAGCRPARITDAQEPVRPTRPDLWHGSATGDAPIGRCEVQLCRYGTARHWRAPPGSHPTTASLNRALLSRGLARRVRPSPAGGRAFWGEGILPADARQGRVGVHVERPEPKARTNDVDAGDERRRISDRNLRQASSIRGCEHSGDRHQSPTSGRAGRGAGCQASLRARPAWLRREAGAGRDGVNEGSLEPPSAGHRREPGAQPDGASEDAHHYSADDDQKLETRDAVCDP